MAATLNQSEGMQMDAQTRFVIAGLIAVSAACPGAPARAAPPTVTPSPGYDARLQESRKATASPTATQSDPSSTPANASVAPRHHVGRKHAH